MFHKLVRMAQSWSCCLFWHLWGHESKNFLDKASSTILNSSGLKTEPWCIPPLTLKALLYLPFILTFVEASSYIAFITDTIHSSTPRYLSIHQTTSRGTLSNAFSKSTKTIHRSLLFARYFSCSWQTMKIASVMLFSAMNPNCMLSILTIFLTLPSIILSKPSLHTPTALCPCMSHMSLHHSYLCKHSPSNSFSNPLVLYHPPPQHYTHQSSTMYQFRILM